MESIKAENLVKTFGTVRALDGVNLSVYPGEIYGIVGPDGAGKTTLMRVLTAIMTPASGDAWVDGFHTVKEAENVKEHIGYMSQRFGLYQDLTVMENILFYADLYDVKGIERENKLEQLLGFSNLTPFKNRLAGNLSGGMKQKLGLACALIHTPKVLFLDEPTNGVDPVSRRDFWKILNSLHAQKTTIFISTSYLDEAERCDRISMINKGKIIATGTPEEIKSLQELAILALKIEEPRSIIEELRKKFGDQAIRLFGGQVHIAIQDPEQGKKEINEILKKMGIGKYTIELSSPTLEDVFISLMTEKSLK